jgi:uncharacterized HAD superfamily protein
VFRKHMSEEDDAKFRLTQILDEVYIYFWKWIRKFKRT